MEEYEIPCKSSLVSCSLFPFFLDPHRSLRRSLVLHSFVSHVCKTKAPLMHDIISRCLTGAFLVVVLITGLSRFSIPFSAGAWLRSTPSPPLGARTPVGESPRPARVGALWYRSGSHADHSHAGRFSARPSNRRCGRKRYDRRTWG